jgi:hypothetical protein
MAMYDESKPKKLEMGEAVPAVIPTTNVMSAQANVPRVLYRRSKMERFLVSKGEDLAAYERTPTSAMKRHVTNKYKIEYETWQEPKKRR